MHGMGMHGAGVHDMVGASEVGVRCKYRDPPPLLAAGSEGRAVGRVADRQYRVLLLCALIPLRPQHLLAPISVGGSHAFI